MSRLGIFPLNTVMFPNAAIPLHIFEERYKTLVNDCILNHAEFGLILMHEGKISNVGCSVDISDIMRSYPDGRMDIVIAGTKRFKLEHFTDGEKAYYVGEVVYFEDETENLNEDLVISAVRLFNKLTESIESVKIEKIDLNEIDIIRPSYYIAQKAGLNLNQRQNILEMRSENLRLLTLVNHLKDMLPLVKEAEIISRIIKYDGYYKPNYFKH